MHIRDVFDDDDGIRLSKNPGTVFKWPDVDVSRLEALIPRLPYREQDILRLRLQHQSQKSIGILLGLSQGGVSDSIDKLIKRLQILVMLPEIDKNEFYADTKTLLRYPRNQKIFYGYYLTSSGTVVSRILSLRQAIVSYALRKNLPRLIGTKYYKPFKLLMDHPCCLWHIEMDPKTNWICNKTYKIEDF